MRHAIRKRTVMVRLVKGRRALIGATLVLCSSISLNLFGYSKYSRSDPYPVYTAANPLGPYTYFADCEEAYTVRFSGSYFRQTASKVGDYHFGLSAGSEEVEIGNIYGPWNVLGLFYPEVWSKCPTPTPNPGPSDPSSKALVVQNYLKFVDNVCTDDDLDPYFDPYQKGYDSDKKTGFFSVPIDYEKYGGRFELNVQSRLGFGIWGGLSAGQIRQAPRFVDQTDYKDLPAAFGPKIMDNLPEMAEALCLSVDPYCRGGLDNVDIAIYLNPCFEFNRPGSPCAESYPRCTFVPFIAFEYSPKTGSGRPLSELFSVGFGNNGHEGVGFDTGFALNFFETIELGFDGGFTSFSGKMYYNAPVPTSDLQSGIFPRKADLYIKPGNNFIFGATMTAFCFVDYFSVSVQFRYVNHAEDCIKIIRTRPLSCYCCPSNGQGVPDFTCPYNLNNVINLDGSFPDSAIDLDMLVQQSWWSSSMVNAALTYDISPRCQLGVLWQTPVRQRFAYRSTTLMGSIIFNF